MIKLAEAVADDDDNAILGTQASYEAAKQTPRNSNLDYDILVLEEDERN